MSTRSGTWRMTRMLPATSPISILFTASMLLLVLGENLLLLFVGWEGVGLCSYLLIGFWYTDDEKASAGKKAFIVNRVGDAGFLLGMFLLVWTLVC